MNVKNTWMKNKSVLYFKSSIVFNLNYAVFQRVVFNCYPSEEKKKKPTKTTHLSVSINIVSLQEFQTI